jgi:uncharacterized protein involved in exopolysaccharide biosynthesis
MNTDEGTNFWLFLEVLTRRRGLIISLTLLAIAGSVVVSLLLPKWYEAEALLLPPKDVIAPVSTTVDLAEVASITGGIDLPVMVTPSDVYARMLRSRAITDRIIAQFDLKSRYRADNMIETRTKLLDLARFRVTDEGLVSIQVEDREPQTAAAIANAFVDELNQVNQDIVSQRARQSRVFIEDRLDAVGGRLKDARRRLEEFQTTYRALDFGEQTRLAISQATDLKVRLAEVDLEIDLHEAVLGHENPTLVELRRRHRAIQNELDKLEYGDGDSSFFALPLAAMPGLKGQFQALSGEVAVTETVYTTLLELYEQAKIQEHSTSTPISVLDRATPPEIRSRPQRSLIVVGTTAIAFVVAVLLAAFLEYFRRLSESRPDDYRRAMEFINAYMGWLPGVRRPK